MLYKDTLVTTPSGMVAIKNLQVGDVVFTTRGTDTVLKNELVAGVQLRRLRVEEDVLLCSLDHEFWVYHFDDFYLFRIPLSDDKLIQYDPLAMKVVPILDNDVWVKGDVYRLHLSEDHHIIIQGNYITRTN